MAKARPDETVSCPRQSGKSEVLGTPGVLIQITVASAKIKQLAKNTGGLHQRTQLKHKEQEGHDKDISAPLGLSNGDRQ